MVARERPTTPGGRFQDGKASWPLEALLRKRSSLGRGCLQRRQESRGMENLRQVWRTQAVQDIQSEKVSSVGHTTKRSDNLLQQARSIGFGSVRRFPCAGNGIYLCPA